MHMEIGGGRGPLIDCRVVTLSPLQGGLSTSTMVKIELEDINDNIPVFSPSVYNVTLEPGHPAGQTFLVLRATDLDSAQFGEVEYFLRSGNTGGAFQLDKQTGELSLYSSLAQSPLLHSLEIVAVDGGEVHWLAAEL